MVLSAYSFNSPSDFVTSSIVVPSFVVFASMVWTALILVSYSLKPVITGLIVNASAILFPALTAELVRFAIAVIPTIDITLNLLLTVSNALLIPFIFTLDDAFSISSKVFAPGRFNFNFSLSRLDIVCFTLFSKLRLSNLISTTRWSTDLLIGMSPLPTFYLSFYQTPDVLLV